MWNQPLGDFMGWDSESRLSRCLLSCAFVATLASAQLFSPNAMTPSPGFLTSAFAQDVNSDGKPDLVFSCASGIGFFAGDGVGGFLPPAVNAFPTSTDEVVGAADVNNDGLTDIVYVVMYGPTTGSYVTLGVGLGMWGPPIALGNPGMPRSTLVGDITGDGVADILVPVSAMSANGGVTLTYAVVRIVGTTPITVTTIPFAVAGSPQNVVAASGDFNLDGVVDIMLSRGAYMFMPPVALPGPCIQFSNGVGGGTFGGPFVIAFPGFSPNPVISVLDFRVSMAKGDVDQDGDQDLICSLSAVTQLSTTTHVFMMATSAIGPFLPMAQVGSLLGPLSTKIQLADIDVDGKLDLLNGLTVRRIIPSLGGQLVIPDPSTPFAQSGSIINPCPFLCTSGLTSFVAEPADFDMDGDVDIAATMFSAGTAQVLSALVYRNRALDHVACTGSSSYTSIFNTGAASPGNAAFALTLIGAPPASPAALFMSFPNPSPITTANGCWFTPSLSPSLIISPNPSLGLTTTDLGGTAQIPLPLPPQNLLPALPIFVDAQWLYVDPTGPIPAGPITYSLSTARRIPLF